MSQQAFFDFKYDQSFGAIIIPAAAFMHIPTQQEQIACLKNIHAHLESNGRLLLNFFIPSLEDLIRHSRKPLVEEEFCTFKHPDKEGPIEGAHKTKLDLGEQRETIYWIFEHNGQRHEVPLNLFV